MHHRFPPFRFQPRTPPARSVVGRCWRALLAALLATPVLASALCSSDGQPPPTGLAERFLRADCADCWTTAPAPTPKGRPLAIDWIVPTGADDDAALSAAATRDAAERLAALGQAAPTRMRAVDTPVRAASAMAVRVAQGPALGGYIGTAIRVAPQRAAHLAPGWTVWLLLVETLPAGTEGSPVARNLARNLLVLEGDRAGSAGRLQESRPMRIPDGAQPERLRLIGWVQDAQGQVLAAAQSVCSAGR